MLLRQREPHILRSVLCSHWTIAHVPVVLCNCHLSLQQSLGSKSDQANASGSFVIPIEGMLKSLTDGGSQNFSTNGRKSISCVQALLSCLCSCQYVSAIASGLMKELCSLSGIISFVRGASIIPSMMICATWMPCSYPCALSIMLSLNAGCCQTGQHLY